MAEKKLPTLFSKMNEDNMKGGIDTNLYSRQIGTFGLETMGKLIQLKVLIIGLKGAGIEVYSINSFACSYIPR